MIAAGVNARRCCLFMGHASITVTFDLYGHLMPGTEAEGAALLHYVAGASPVGTRAFSEALAVDAILRTVPYAVLGEGTGSGSPATIKAVYMTASSVPSGEWSAIATL
jgi:hypothetical protein